MVAAVALSLIVADARSARCLSPIAVEVGRRVFGFLTSYIAGKFIDRYILQEDEKYLVEIQERVSGEDLAYVQAQLSAIRAMIEGSASKAELRALHATLGSHERRLAALENRMEHVWDIQGEVERLRRRQETTERSLQDLHEKSAVSRVSDELERRRLQLLEVESARLRAQAEADRLSLATFVAQREEEKQRREDEVFRQEFVDLASLRALELDGPAVLLAIDGSPDVEAKIALILRQAGFSVHRGLIGRSVFAPDLYQSLLSGHRPTLERLQLAGLRANLVIGQVVLGSKHAPRSRISDYIETEARMSLAFVSLRGSSTSVIDIVEVGAGYGVGYARRASIERLLEALVEHPSFELAVRSR